MAVSLGQVLRIVGPPCWYAILRWTPLSVLQGTMTGNSCGKQIRKPD